MLLKIKKYANADIIIDKKSKNNYITYVQVGSMKKFVGRSNNRIDAIFLGEFVIEHKDNTILLNE